MKIVYFGTAQFAVAPLKALLAHPELGTVAAVVSQPDKPFGRKRELTAVPVAALAREAGLPLLQPARLKDDAFVAAIRALAPDLIITASYGRIIPQAVLDSARVAPLNLHGSLLPKYRGASPIQAAILAGETTTGVSLMVMDAEVDHGPVVSDIEVPIAADDTHTSLERKLGDAAATLLVRDLARFCAGELRAVPQLHDRATHTALIAKEDGRIEWSTEDAAHIERKTRAYSPWPSTYFVWQRGATAVRIKILRAAVHVAPAGMLSGTCFVSPSGNPAVVAAHGAVELLEVQSEGKGAMAGKAFLNGSRDFAGSVL